MCPTNITQSIVSLLRAVHGNPPVGTQAQLVQNTTTNERSMPYDPRKVAVLIENRPMTNLVPILLHFTSTIPPEWRVQFIGSDESVALVNSKPAIRQHVAIGKMDLKYIPSNTSVAGQNEISAFLTDPWFYEHMIYPAEHLLIFQTDSMLCSRSQQSLNDWLEYDWVGAPWPYRDDGGNGGLSLRKVSAILDILRATSWSPAGGFEDWWLVDQLSKRPGAKMASQTLQTNFSGEQMRSVRPMGYHTGNGGNTLHGSNWGTPELRKQIYDYCPEIKMMLRVDAAKYVPGNCNEKWKKRDMQGDEGELSAFSAW